MQQPPTTGPGLAIGALAFVGELVLWVGAGRLAYLLARSAGTPVGLMAGVAASVAFVIGWSLFLAPRARWRLGLGGRIVVIALCTAGIVAGLAVLHDATAALLVLAAGLAVAAGQFLLSRR